MKTARYFLPVILVLFTSAALLAQTARQQAEEDFVRINKKYEKEGKYQVNLAYALFSDTLPGTPVSEMSGVTIVNGTRKYQKVGEMESYYTDQYCIVFNHTLKTLSFMPPAAKTTADADRGFQNLAAFIQQCDTITVAEHKGNKVYSFEGLTGNYNKVEVAFDKKTYLVHSVKLISAHQASSLLVTYSDFNTKAIPGEEWFAYTKFLSYENKKLKCKTPFESYELFNQITNPEIIK